MDRTNVRYKEDRHITVFSTKVSSTSSDRSTSDSTSRTEDSPEPQHPDPSANVDTALSVHLRAMKARRESKKKERKIALSRASSE